jgi:hypothetical protein
MNHAPLAPSITPVPAPPDPEITVVEPSNSVLQTLDSAIWPDVIPFGQDMPFWWHLAIVVCTLMLIGEAIRLTRRRFARAQDTDDWDDPTEELTIAPDSVSERTRRDILRASESVDAAPSRTRLSPLSPEAEPDTFDDWADWVEVALENSRSRDPEYTDDRGVPSYETYGLHPDTGSESHSGPVRDDEAVVVDLASRRAVRG